MEVTFTRIDEPRSFSTAVRDDRVTVRVPGYGPVLPLPHDLAHCVVERELGLRRGFWGSVAAGALFPGMAVLSGRQLPHAAERGRMIIKENSAHITRAEVLVGAFDTLAQRGWDARPGLALAQLAEAQSAVRLGPCPIDSTVVARVCAALRDAASRWQQLDTVGQLTVSWQISAASRHIPRERHTTRPVHRVAVHARR